MEKNPNPSREKIGKLHEHYMMKLRELFDKHKSKYAKKDCKLIIN